MTKIERTEHQVVVRSGSATLTLDKEVGKVRMQRKLLFWAKKPLERALSDIASIDMEGSVDRASGVELCRPMLVMHDGSAWALPHTGQSDAAETASVLNDFLGLPGT